MALRQHYWTPRHDQTSYVDETKLIHTFNCRQKAGTWSDRHSHAGWGEITYVCTGSIVVCSTQGNYLSHVARAVWIPPGLFHEWYMPERSWNRSLFVHPSIFGTCERLNRLHSVEVTPLLREVLFALHDLQPDFASEEGRRLALFFMDRLKDATASESSLIMPAERRLVELCTEVLTNVDRPVRLADWSRRLGASEKTLTRLFLKETGMPFGRWLHSVRLARARADIEQGQGVTDVAMNCGYTSLSAFINAFKKQFGVTPGSIAKGLRRQSSPSSLAACLPDTDPDT